MSAVSLSDPATALPAILAVGMGAQWVASRLRIPAIILLLTVGFAVGPVLGWVDPDEILGGLLFPGVSMAVALLLFEGGLNLRWGQLGEAKRPLLRLLTIGTLITFVLATILAMTLTDLPDGPAVLFGAIMVVTGPTVVIPLVAEARLRPRLATLLRWEGIFIDPIGAVLGVTVLEILLSQGEHPGRGLPELVVTTALTSLWGVAVGLAVGIGLTAVLKRHWVADVQVNALCLAVVLASWAGANLVYHESGLYSATIVGLVLANQKSFPIRPIQEFQEAVAPLLLGTVFVILAARVNVDALRAVLVPGLLVSVGLIVLVRPLAVGASTHGTALTANERKYTGLLAPRGIVAASVSALFGLSLEKAGIPGGAQLAALTFVVVGATVIVYGLAARPTARWLHVAKPDPKGVALVGAAPWVVDLAECLGEAEVSVLLITTDEKEAETARDHELLVYDDRLTGDELIEALDFLGAKLAIAVSTNEELAELVVERVVPHLGRANVFRVDRTADEHADSESKPAREGRDAFGGRFTQDKVEQAVREGGRFAVVTPAEAEADGVLPLLSVAEDGTPHLVGADLVADQRHARVVAMVGTPSKLPNS